MGDIRKEGEGNVPGISNGHSINVCYGVRNGFGLNNASGINDGLCISGGSGINSSCGISNSLGINRSYGIANSKGINYSFGIRDSNGVNRSMYCMGCTGISNCIFGYYLTGNYYVFNKNVTKERFDEIWYWVTKYANGWYPDFTNAQELKAKHGNGSWEGTPAEEIQGRSAKEAYADMPQELRGYIQSLPEYDEAIFKAITDCGEMPVSYSEEAQEAKTAPTSEETAQQADGKHKRKRRRRKPSTASVVIVTIALVISGVISLVSLFCLPNENVSAPTTVVETKPTATPGEFNALISALLYLDTMPFSRKGLIEQLEYEGYTHSEALYAVSHCGVDWYEQAELMAESYLDTMPFSRNGLIEQLEYEGFTYDQAVHGVNAVYGVNYYTFF